MTSDNVNIGKRVYEYEGTVLEITRDSPSSAMIELKCGEHEHKEFMVSLVEHHALGWYVGRKDGGHPVDGRFIDAVEHVADLLIEECEAMAQIDVFFAVE